MVGFLFKPAMLNSSKSHYVTPLQEKVSVWAFFSLFEHLFHQGTCHLSCGQDRKCAFRTTWIRPRIIMLMSLKSIKRLIKIMKWHSGRNSSDWEPLLATELENLNSSNILDSEKTGWQFFTRTLKTQNIGKNKYNFKFSLYTDYLPNI